MYFSMKMVLFKTLSMTKAYTYDTKKKSDSKMNVSLLFPLTETFLVKCVHSLAGLFW